MNDAGDDAAFDRKGDRHRPSRIASHESARAVDRIGNDERRSGDASRIVRGLLGKPAGIGKFGPETRAQESIDREVRARDRRAAVLVVDRSPRFRAPEAKSRIAISPPRRAASTSAASAWAARASRPGSMEFALVMARALLYWRRGSRAMGSARFCSRMRRARYRGENDRRPRGQNLYLVPAPSHLDRLFSTHC